MVTYLLQAKVDDTTQTYSHEHNYLRTALWLRLEYLISDHNISNTKKNIQHWGFAGRHRPNY